MTLTALSVTLKAESPTSETKSSMWENIKKINDTPEWLNRVDFDIDISQHDIINKPTFSIETIQPLYQSEETLRHTVFGQVRAAHKNHDETYNMGLGYRQQLRASEFTEAKSSLK